MILPGLLRFVDWLIVMFSEPPNRIRNFFTSMMGFSCSLEMAFFSENDDCRSVKWLAHELVPMDIIDVE